MAEWGRHLTVDDILIFSSREQLELAKKIQNSFYEERVICRIWTNDYFKESTYTLDNFKNLAVDCRKAIVILGADDETIMRGKTYQSPRDNVLLELGICIGALGLKNTFFVLPENVKLPSDLHGVTPIKIDSKAPVDITASVIVSSVRGYFAPNEAHLSIKNMIMWEEYANLVNILLGKLKQSVNFGGYYFDVILSVSRGGSVLSNVIARTYGQNMPVYYLLEDRRDGNGAYDTKEVRRANTSVIKLIEACDYQHILLVDSAVRTGTTLTRVEPFIKSAMRKPVTIK